MFNAGDFINRLGIMGRVTLASADTLYLSTGTSKKDAREVPNDQFVDKAEEHEVAQILWWHGEISDVERDMKYNRCPCFVCSDVSHLTLAGMQFEYF